MNSTSDAIHPLVQAVIRAQARYQLLPHPSDQPIPLVVGVSGGADSVCLLHILYTLRVQWGLALHVAHLDHGVRPDSALDAAFVQQLAQQWNLPFHIQRLSHVTPTSDQEGALINEATLRTLRYKFLFHVARTVTSLNQTPILAVAHHANDQAETVLLRLTRGAGPRSLGGMAAITQQFNPDSKQYVQVVRPLLDVRRSEIVRYLHDQNVAWREDPSNQQLRYARNRIRHQVLPALQTLNPQAVEAIGRTARLLQESAQRLAKLDRQLLESLRVGQAESDRVQLDLAKFQALEASEQRALLHLALHDLLGEPATEMEFSFEQIEGMRQPLQNQQGASQSHPIVADLVWSVLASNAVQSLTLSLHRIEITAQRIDHPLLPEHFPTQRLQVDTTILIGEWQLQISQLERIDLPENWQKNPDHWQAWLDADRVGEPVLCNGSLGLRIAPLGMAGKSKALGDFFTDCKIHPSLRKQWPVILDQTSGQILWVCGLAITHPARITEVTKRVLQLKWQTSK